jgi:hypothetical protein
MVYISECKIDEDEYTKKYEIIFFIIETPKNDLNGGPRGEFRGEDGSDVVAMGC